MGVKGDCPTPSSGRGKLQQQVDQHLIIVETPNQQTGPGPSVEPIYKWHRLRNWYWQGLSLSMTAGHLVIVPITLRHMADVRRSHADGGRKAPPASTRAGGRGPVRRAGARDLGDVWEAYRPACGAS